MQKHLGLLWTVGLIGWFAAADAQTASPPAASTQFDGTYAFVSATKLNETRMTYSHHILQCEDRRRKSLIIINGQARLPVFEGMVGSQGELALRHVPTPGKGGSAGVERIIYGRIDDNGTVRAREIGRGCNYDLIWRKESK
jgi:hypothetical protein